jgi:hypothetical protein
MLDSKSKELDDMDAVFEEIHYNRTLDDFVELIVVYGYKQVVTDLGAKLEAKTW